VLISKYPEDATETMNKDDDVRQAIEAGLRDAAEGRVVSVDEVRAMFGLPALAAWHEVYAGLSEDEIAAVEAMALDRNRSFRQEPE
jgi:hypothetical protein